MNIQRPRYNSMTVPEALAMDWRGCHLSQKMDGVWAVRDFAGCIVTGELMRDGKFYPFDIAQAFGRDIRPRPWTERHAALLELLATVPARLHWHRIAAGHGAEFIEAVLARGGEGVVAKNWSAPFGRDWAKVKHVSTFDCVVTEKRFGVNSIRLEFDGEDCGFCPCSGWTLHTLKVGDCVEVIAQGRHPSGKFREARLFRVRDDKKEFHA